MMKSYRGITVNLPEGYDVSCNLCYKGKEAVIKINRYNFPEIILTPEKYSS